MKHGFHMRNGKFIFENFTYTLYITYGIEILSLLNTIFTSEITCEMFVQVCTCATVVSYPDLFLLFLVG